MNSRLFVQSPLFDFIVLCVSMSLWPSAESNWHEDRREQPAALVLVSCGAHERGAPPMTPENVTRMLENWALSWLLIDPFVAG